MAIGILTLIRISSTWRCLLETSIKTVYFTQAQAQNLAQGSQKYK
jgi:hypothetical protein